MNRTYSTREVARKLGVSVQSVQRWVDLGRLRAWVTPGGHRRIDADDAEAMFREQSESHPVALPVPWPNGANPATTVLVVDDNDMDRELAILQVQGALPDATVTAVSTGFEALIAVGHERFDVLLTDVVMPKMDGFEMLRHIAINGSHRPGCVLATSSHSLEELRSFGVLPPGVGFMAKPLEAEALAAWLDSKLGSERPATAE